MLRKPVPTGVVIGAFSAHLVRWTLSMVPSGSGVPVRAITSTPASCTSQLIFTPVASMHRRAASANSGPVPSPVISVTSCAMISCFNCRKAAALAAEISLLSEANKCALGASTIPGR